MMNSDLRLIRLCRRTNEGEAKENDDSQQYLSTDYFDVLHCIKKELWDDFDSIMGIGGSGQQNASEIAIQSYTLYCDGKTSVKYRNCKCYGDPFDDLAEKDKPFLSIIQLYITPEFIARAECGKELIANIEEDIHDILNSYIAKYTQPICYKVYKLLSTGDFAVVVRSSMPETSYEISTLLRKRYVCVRDNIIDDQQKIVLYKTYTLLTMAHRVINTGENEEDFDNSKDNRFVIRGCFSNKYWSEKEKVDDFWKDKEGFSDIKIYFLNGRYDFTVYLTEGEFREVFPFIIYYKKINFETNEFEKYDVNEIDRADTVHYLIYLMKQGYLSYINERYLLTKIKTHVKDGDKSKFASVKNQKYVSHYNIKKYEKVQRLYDTVAERIYELCTNRKKLVHYMELLHKLIELCQSINNLSDTRISVSILLEQIKILLDSMNSYIEYIDHGHEYESGLLSLIEQYLRESVGALDVYSRYIRNNNLQSLQAPNYNIESNTSMEKLLTAFGEYIYMVINDYISCNTALTEKPVLPTKEYTPIVVPNLGKKEVSVEVMFPEWNIYEGHNFTNRVKKYLMIITCPTVKELGNVPVIMASLLHEIAHQFRYEGRDARNSSILTYVLLDFFELLSNGLIKEFELLRSNSDVEKRSMFIFRSAFLETFFEVWLEEAHKWKDKIEDIDLVNSGKESAIAYYEECIWNNMNMFLESWKNTVNLSLHVNQFVRCVLQHVSVEDDKIKKRLKEIEEIIDTIQNKELAFEEWKKAVDRLRDSTIALFINGGEQILSKDERQRDMWNGMWDGVVEEPRGLWDRLENEVFFDNFPETRIKLLEMRNALRGWCQWHSQLGREEYEQSVLIKIRKKYVKAVYVKTCEKWKDYSDETKENQLEMGMTQQLLNETGRYFGIDSNQDGNEKRFAGILKNDISKAGNDALEKIREDIEAYREETSDMFMCSRMPLTALGYINLIAREIVIDGEVSTDNLRRIIYVVAVMWCKIDSPDFDEFYQSYQEQCTQLFYEIKKYMNVIVTDYGLKEWKNDICKWTNSRSYSLINTFSGQIIECYHYIRARQAENSELERTLIYPATMLKILYNMVCHGEGILIRLFGDASANDDNVYTLKMDYIRGRDFFRRFNQIERTEDMKILNKRFKRIADIINEPWRDFQQNRKAEVNKEVIEFLLDMYYGNKRRNAQKSGEGEKSGD